MFFHRSCLAHYTLCCRKSKNAGNKIRSCIFDLQRDSSTPSGCAKARPREGQGRGATDEIGPFPIIPQFAAGFFQKAAPHHKAARAKFIAIIRQSVHKRLLMRSSVYTHSIAQTAQAKHAQLRPKPAQIFRAPHAGKTPKLPIFAFICPKTNQHIEKSPCQTIIKNRGMLCAPCRATKRGCICFDIEKSRPS